MLLITAAIEREGALQHHAIIGAWYAAAWGRAKQMPTLKSVVKRLRKTKDPASRPAKPKEQVRLLEALNAQFGGRDLRKLN